MLSTYHFYVVFNPLIKPVPDHPTQAHEFYHALKGSMTHLWWGKIRKTTTQGQLNIGNYREVIEVNKKAGNETVLFITDFTHLWVAKVEDATDERPAPHETLSVYENETVEIWFKVTDMDLISSDVNATRKKIADLGMKNHFYPNSEVRNLSPQTGALRFPVIVEDQAAEHYFLQYKNRKRLVVDNPLIEKSEEGWESRAKVTYTISQKNFKKLPALMQKQVMWAEGVFAQDMGKAAGNYLRILESVLNVTLLREIHARVSVPDTYVPLTEIYGVLNSTKYHGTNIDELLSNSVHKEFWEFCKFDLRNFLHMPVAGKKVAELGSSDQLKPEAALFVRNSMLGVGCKGIINEIIERYEEIAKLTLEGEQRAG